MNADSLSQFSRALEQCATCGSQCTATLPATDLARAVKEVVAEFGPPSWAKATLPLEYPPETLLLILTYSYACGVFGSEEIAEELEDRADRCALVKHLAIDALTLAEFRRENHTLLRRCLAAVLRRSEAVRLPGVRSQSGAAPGAPEQGDRVNRPLDSEREAERRIVLAAQTDSEERDL
jgi:hypothetical protein